MFLEYLFIEFIGHLSPWKYHEIPDVHSPNGGMSHLLFLVTIRALHIYSSRRPIPSISPKEPPSFFKPEASELVAVAIEIISPFSQRHHYVCGLHGECAQYPNHRVRPTILPLSAPAF